MSSQYLADYKAAREILFYKTHDLFMKNKLALFKALPFWLASGMILLSLVRRVFRIPVTFSYSQGSEDLIADHYLRYQFGMGMTGTYIDVGCNAPVRYSNTFELYTRGWRGINIDANVDLINRCKHVRKQDISLQAAISDGEREVTFHKSKDDAVSTIDEERLVEWKKNWEFSDEDQETVVTKTLTSVLDANLPSGTNIDLLTIDVEGHDLQVLKGLDLAKYRPKVIIIEIHALDKVQDNDIYKYLTANGYTLKAFAILSAYFVDGKIPNFTSTGNLNAKEESTTV
jgi:FkbM family methyltransferase